MGNCNQKNKLPIVQGINITPNFKVYESYVNESSINNSYVNQSKFMDSTPEFYHTVILIAQNSYQINLRREFWINSPFVHFDLNFQ